MTTMHCVMSIQHGRALFFEQTPQSTRLPYCKRDDIDSLALLVLNLDTTESWEIHRNRINSDGTDLISNLGEDDNSAADSP